MGPIYTTRERQIMESTVYTLDSAEAMRSRLNAISQETALVQKLHEPLIKVLAGQQKVAQGVYLAYQLSLHDFGQGYPPMLMRLVSMQEDEYLKALCGDNEALHREVLEFREQVLASMK